jgi:hypothetical protein
MWSCALPKEQHETNSPHDPDRPNFRIQISFQNGTFEHSTLAAPESGVVRRMSFREFAWLTKRDLADETDPVPPSLDDMEFLGNTTDAVTPPSFSGEETPFFATFLSPKVLPPSGTVRKRQNSPSSPTSFPNLTEVIPPPALEDDGTAAETKLYPLPVAQPIRLFDRGLSSEHYGFYIYFDKSIFLKSTEPINGTSPDKELQIVPDDLDGGSGKSAARVRCTWAQTRFLVQIWTQGRKSGKVLINGAPPSPTPTPTSPSTPITSEVSSANDFVRPGSFPYPISITIDRHGGAAKEKMVYCHALDLRSRPIQNQKKLQLEFRDFGGTLINPATGLFNLPGDDETGGGTGDGIDGGTGGCQCQWRNWISIS